eukprot:4895201-Pyramimonas_sp.AAC.1
MCSILRAQRRQRKRTPLPSVNCSGVSTSTPLKKLCFTGDDIVSLVRSISAGTSPTSSQPPPSSSSSLS